MLSVSIPDKIVAKMCFFTTSTFFTERYRRGKGTYSTSVYKDMKALPTLSSINDTNDKNQTNTRRTTGGKEHTPQPQRAEFCHLQQQEE